MRGRKPLSIAEIFMGEVMVGAVATGNYDYQPMYDRHHTMDEVVSYMGFDNIDSYMTQYPGKFLKGSAGDNQYCVMGSAYYHNPLERVLNLYCSIVHIVTTKSTTTETTYNIENFNVRVWHLLSRGMLGNDSFMLPLTTDEVKHSLGFTDVPKSEMWYCVDWKG